MSSTVNIIIVETSQVLFEGLLQALSRSGISCHVRHALSMAEAGKQVCLSPQSIIILNPAMIQYQLKEFHSSKKNWNQVRWIALVYQAYEQQLLSLFDEVIHISDSFAVIASVISRMVRAKPLKEPKNQDGVLSDRETEVLQLLARGLSNKEIADRLNISINTAITHRKNICQKTGIKTVSGLTIYAVTNKLVTLENL